MAKKLLQYSSRFGVLPWEHFVGAQCILAQGNFGGPLVNRVSFLKLGQVDKVDVSRFDSLYKNYLRRWFQSCAVR